MSIDPAKIFQKILFFGFIFCYVSNIHTLDRALRGNDHFSGRPAPPGLPVFLPFRFWLRFHSAVCLLP